MSPPPRDGRGYLFHYEITILHGAGDIATLVRRNDSHGSAGYHFRTGQIAEVLYEKRLQAIESESVRRALRYINVNSSVR